VLTARNRLASVNRKQRNVKTRAVALIAVLALAGAACGDDDDDAGVTDGGTGATVEGEAADSGDSGDSGDGGGDWCDLARELDADESVLDDLDFTDPESLEDAFRQVVDTIENAADEAPDEIRDDVNLIADGFNDLVDELERVDFNFLDVDSSVLDNPELEAASDRIADYNERVCGIETDDLDGVGDLEDVDDLDDTVDSIVDDVEDETGGTIPSEGTIRDQMVAQFTAMGMTEEQANCLVDNIDFQELGSEDADPMEFLELFETCDVDITELQPGG
jgi:hypothetical protein